MTDSSARGVVLAWATVAALVTGCGAADQPHLAAGQEAATADPTPSDPTPSAPTPAASEVPRKQSAQATPKPGPTIAAETVKPSDSSRSASRRTLSEAQIAAMTQARATVSDRAVMRQLASSAERIAQRMATGEPATAPPPADLDPGSNRALGHRLMVEFGFAPDQWPALDRLWQRESGWSYRAQNPSSGAYGIPQSLPAAKMAVVGADWRSNPETQIRWGLAYIAERYGTPDRAWAHSERVGWY